MTDINTAKAVARKLYMQYCNGGQMERLAIERMLVDTYKIMVRLAPYRTNIISRPITILISITRFSTSIRMAESPLMTFRHWLLSILPGLKKGKCVFS